MKVGGRALAALGVVVLAAVAGLWLVVRDADRREPGCTITALTPAANQPATFELSHEQAGNAATIAAVGSRLGVPNHAVTVALATAMQESKLRNLDGGDRDSLGLFQQRPSQGWGTPSQILDPVYSATAFYQRLTAQRGWATLSVTDAAQRVQRSAAPLAYAQWEPLARATARTLTGEVPAALSCHRLPAGTPEAGLIQVANAELGTAVLSGDHHAPARGWAISSWLVAHGAQLGVEQVNYDGHQWTAESGAWAQVGPRNGALSLQQAAA
ncbi:MAG: hypothetical protein H0W01_04220 [Pseudonocardiales bacterium]|nr:hypothetical protein [Pseudonocardiales bacterium]